MGKTKGPPGVPNRNVYTRASYLYQAATYLASQAASPPTQTNYDTTKQRQQKTMQNMSRQALSDMKAISLKAQIRHSTALKRTICKFCDTLLVEGETCHSTIENPSKGGLKPWADVLVTRCETCGRVKRYPVNEARQKRRPLRQVEEKEVHTSNEGDEGRMDTDYVSGE